MVDKLETVFKRKYPRYAGRILAIWEIYTGTKPLWTSLSMNNLNKFREGLLAEVSINSAVTYGKMFKAVLSSCSDEVHIPNAYNRILAFKKEATLSTWLTEEEIDVLLHAATHNELERLVLTQFLLGCLTGARHSDFINFTEDNIRDDKLVYVSQKSKIKSEIPLAPAVVRLIATRDGVGEVVESTFNRVIRRICEREGITQNTQVYRGGRYQHGPKYLFVSSHTARRSFATNLYLRCRDLYLVSTYMGHSRVDQTTKYIMSMGDAPVDVQAFFDRFK